MQIHLPPLRERREDIAELAAYFLREFCPQYGKEVPEITGAALEAMGDYSWPGNIRELRNIIERGCLKCRGGVFGVDLLTEIMAGGKTSPAQNISAGKVFDLAGRERELIRRVLKECGWNQSQAAVRLSITRNTLRYRMKKYGIKKL